MEEKGHFFLTEELQLIKVEGPPGWLSSWSKQLWISSTGCLGSFSSLDFILSCQNQTEVSRSLWAKRLA